MVLIQQTQDAPIVFKSKPREFVTLDLFTRHLSVDVPTPVLCSDDTDNLLVDGLVAALIPERFGTGHLLATQVIDVFIDSEDMPHEGVCLSPCATA